MKSKERNSLWQSEKGVAAIIASTPLVNGHALGVAFLGISYFFHFVHDHELNVVDFSRMFGQ
jgi:hypothetical protein